METTLGKIMMEIEGGGRGFAVAELLGSAMKEDLVLTGTIEAKQANIGELSISADTAAELKSASKTGTRGSYKNNKGNWGNRKLGAPRQESAKVEYTDLSEAQRRERRREPVTGAFGEKGFVALTRKTKGTTVTVIPEHTVDRETGELKAFKPKKMSKMEFDGSKTKHDKIFAKDSSGKWVHNSAAARTYRQQVWNHFNWRKADLSEQPEHPNAMAVQLAGV
tara:strand:+ start:1395 stop:2060 length:666 start_codon:yes stop_codon:yes gene_type:complete